MRFTGIKELKQKTMGVIEACKTEDVIITAYGKPMAILHHITAEYTLAGGLTADSLITKLESRRVAKKV
jgi:antitoxin (DNA-binding transcriptional repressor) of toxin-antitoxin stability system